MIAAGHTHDPLACDVPEADIIMIYTQIYKAMIAAAQKEPKT